MENTNKLRLSLILTLIGILCLLILGNFSSPRQINTNSDIKINEYVKITGKVIAEKFYDSFTILTLKDEYGTIKATCNCNNLINKTVQIKGKITQYNKQMQIQSDLIKIISTDIQD